MRRTTRAGWAKVALALLAAGTLLAPSARADVVQDTIDLATEEASSACKTHYERNVNQYSTVCIMVEGLDRWADASYDGPNYVTSFIEATVFVEKCQEGGVNCRTVSANGTQSQYGETDELGRYYIRTSAKQASYGWSYRACYSFKNNETAYEVVNRCTRFVSGAPAPALGGNDD
jgi:hypothetical protein